MNPYPTKDLYTVLVIDDAVENLKLMAGILENRYSVKAVKHGNKGIEIAKSENPDLILLDVMMPAPDGYEVCSHLKTDPETRDIPIIFLTSLDDMRDEARGLALGAADYIQKPVNPPILLARVATQLALKDSIDKLHWQNDNLELEVSQRTKDLVSIQDVTILLAAALAEIRDNETGSHLLRTQSYVKALAEEVSDHPRFRNQLNESIIQQLYRSAPLHDIGKVGIQDSILLKPGKLTKAEFETMKTHTILGWQAIRQSEKTLNQGPVDFLKIAKEISRHHHERWDGSGYPDGLKGNEIPLSARLMAIADVYDALINRRVYKPAFELSASMQIIFEKSGNHFDPDLTQAFITIQSQIEKIATRFADSTTPIK